MKKISVTATATFTATVHFSLLFSSDVPAKHAFTATFYFSTSYVINSTESYSYDVANSRSCFLIGSWKLQSKVIYFPFMC